MQMYSLQELLKQYAEWGFNFVSISIATQIPEAIANYIGVDVDGLLAFESSSDKDRIEKCIAHLFTTFIRNPRYSI